MILFLNPLLENRIPLMHFPMFLPMVPAIRKTLFLLWPKRIKKRFLKGSSFWCPGFSTPWGRVRDIDTLKYPTLKGFWKEDIHLTTNLSYEEEVVGGVPYRKALLASYALFPMDEGSAVIDPYKAKATIVGLNLRNFQTVKSSREIPIVVKPLPAENRPSHFTGGLESFK